MTLTSHGHKIPGSPDYDDSIEVPVARCGGPAICSKCRGEAERYLNGRAGAHMKMSAEAHGDGLLTAGEAMHQLIGVPPDAIVHIRTDGNQHDGTFWSIRAEWDRSDAPPVIPDEPKLHHHPFHETGELRIGDSIRQVHIPVGDDAGYAAPRPTTGPITQQNEKHYGRLADG